MLITATPQARGGQLHNSCNSELCTLGVLPAKDYLQEITKKMAQFVLSDPGVPGVRSMGPDVSKSVHTRGFVDLTDVTLADEDSNSIPTSDVNRAFLGNVAMQVALSGGQH